MSCCLPSGSMLTRAEREAIAKLREQRAQGRVPISAAHRAPIQRTEPLVTFYQRNPKPATRPPPKKHLHKPPALSHSVARPRPAIPTRRPPRQISDHPHPRHRHRANQSSGATRQKSRLDGEYPSNRPLKKLQFAGNSDPKRANTRKRSFMVEQIGKMSPKNMLGLAREEDRSNRDEANKGPVKSFAATTTTTTGTTATSKSSALGDAIKALSIWHAMKTGQKADESKPSESSSSGSPVHSEKEALYRSSDRDAHRDKASSRGGKKNSTVRRKGAARLKWDEVVTRLGGNPAKGERFVIKQKLDPADLAESINDRYFQELMRSEL